MTDLYLIAHKVRGEPAFDIACTLDCPHCQPLGSEVMSENCIECDGIGYWWIIPTSGHRAYPWWHCELTYSPDGYEERLDCCVPPMPLDHPDHYHLDQPRPAASLLDRLNLRPTQAPIIRRI